MMCGSALGIPTLLILDYEYIAKMGFIRPDWIFVPEMIPDSKELRPTQDAFSESFNGKLQDECLNQNWFLDLRKTR